MVILIHTSPERERYVKKFLIPRLSKGGRNTYLIHCDYEKKGNLKAYLDSYRDEWLLREGNTWHFEDDVYPDRRFNEWAEALEDYKGIICGYGSKGCKNVLGEARPEDMWYSFPCIRIPNDYIQGFLKWFETAKDEDVERKVREGMGIDLIFRKYVLENPIPIFHHNPCMVEHVDDYLGGSLISERYKTPKAVKFEDSLEDLEAWQQS